MWGADGTSREGRGRGRLYPSNIAFLLRTLAGLLAEGRQLPEFLEGEGVGAVVGFLTRFLSHMERVGMGQGELLLSAACSAAECLLYMLRSSHAYAEVRGICDATLQGWVLPCISVQRSVLSHRRARSALALHSCVWRRRLPQEASRALLDAEGAANVALLLRLLASEACQDRGSIFR